MNKIIKITWLNGDETLLDVPESEWKEIYKHIYNYEFTSYIQNDDGKFINLRYAREINCLDADVRNVNDACINRHD